MVVFSIKAITENARSPVFALKAEQKLKPSLVWFPAVLSRPQLASVSLFSLMGVKS